MIVMNNTSDGNNRDEDVDNNAKILSKTKKMMYNIEDSSRVEITNKGLIVAGWATRLLLPLACLS